MALDYTHPGGPTLKRVYLDIMLGNVTVTHPVPAAPGAPLLAPSSTAAQRVNRATTFEQVESVLNNMWWEYEKFVLSCHPAFKPRREKGEAWYLDLRKRIVLRTWKHRGLGSGAKAAVEALRSSLMEAEDDLRSNCYEPNARPIVCYDHPPAMPTGCTIKSAPLKPAEMELVAKRLQEFRDNMSTAVGQVQAYIAVLVSDANKRQVWFDNAIKLVTAVTALGSALVPI